MFAKQRLVMRAAGVSVWLLAPSVMLGVLVSTLYIATALCNAMLFNELLGNRRVPTVLWLIVVIASLLLIRPLLEVSGQLLQNRAGLVVKFRLRKALLQQLDARGPMRGGLGRSGQIQSVLTDGVEAIEPYFVKYFTQLAITALTAVCLTIAIALISPIIAGVLLICGVAIIVIPRLWDRALADRGQSHWIAYENLNADFVDSMMGMSTLKSFGAAKDYGAQLERQSSQLLKTTMGQLRLSLGETGLSGMMKVLGPALGLVIAISLITSEMMPISSLFVVTLLAIELFRPFTSLSACWHEAFFGISALPAMSEMFEEEQNLSTSCSSSQNLSHGNVISFTDVSYTYPGAAQSALEQATFTAPAGKTTALVGLSGSGKSTALGLLMGFDRPDSGAITVGGVSSDSLDIASTVTLVPQDPIIFPGTVRSILTEANPKANEKDMMTALELACAENLHPNDNLESGDDILDLKIDEHAQNLSGGQKQRLAIARALVRKCPLLVLDESTSALDTQTETTVLANIRSAYPDLTLLLVTHRIDTAKQVDHVVVMEDGKVSCAGDPRILGREDNSWSRLISMQIGD